MRTLDRWFCAAAGSSARRGIGPLAMLAVLIILTSSALPCSDHEDPAVGRDRLAENYPGALDVLPAITAARKEKLLPPANPMAALFVDRFPLQRHIRLIEGFERLLNATAGEAAPVPFSLVLIEPMLWTRFTAGQNRAHAQIHTAGAEAGELVLVSGEDVIVALGEGRMTLADAHRRGMLGLHGDAPQVAQFLSLFGLSGGQHAGLESR